MIFLKRLRRWWFRLVIGLAVFGAALCVAALFFARTFLRTENVQGKADVIVILGGETVHRWGRALELYKQGVAPQMIVAGQGDCDEVRRALVREGVPNDAITLECQSRSTRENALFTVPLLRARSCRRVIIVTSWFHSRRALHCFQHYAPEIEFVSLPTTADLPKSHWPDKYERRSVLIEYAKVLYYWLRYGIAPV